MDFKGFKDKNKEIHLRDYWLVLSKRRQAVVGVFLFIVVLTTAYSFLSTPIYTGTAQVLFELERNPTTTFVEGEGGYVQMKNAKEYFHTQAEILKSRAFADRVVRKFSLDKNPYFIEKREELSDSILSETMNGIKAFFDGLFKGADDTKDPFPDFPNQEELDPLLTEIVLDGIKVAVGKENNIVKINYYSDNPKVSAVMANSVADAYIEHNLEIRVKPFRDAVEWLSARIVELRGKVEESEKTLQRYKETKGIVSFEAKENVLNQELNQVVAQLVIVESQRQDYEIRYNQIKKVIDNPAILTTVPDIMNNLVIQGLRNQELEVKKKLGQLSEKYGPKHPEMVNVKKELETVQSSIIAEARKMLDAAKTQYEITLSRENSLRKRIEEQKQLVLDLSRKAIEFNVVAGESLSNKEFYELLLKKLQEASLSSGVSIANVQVIDKAIIPEFPTTPKKALNISIAIVFGLLSGAIGALFVEYMDDTVKTEEDVRDALGLPFLGFIPSAASNGKRAGALWTLDDPKSTVSEAYRLLRTGIMLSSKLNEEKRGRKVLLVTSSVETEGKTTTAANLAVSMAQMGERVLLIDCDLRRKGVHKAFSMDNSVGLTDVIAMDLDPLKAVRTAPGTENLSVITAGTHVSNPAELLSSVRMKNFIEGLKTRYDHIILDSPPLLSVSDAMVLSTLADGVVLVVWGGETSADAVQRAIRMLPDIESKYMGVVLNNVSFKNLAYYSYYPYAYGETENVRTKR